jgi:hypothetical protein
MASGPDQGQIVHSQAKASKQSPFFRLFKRLTKIVLTIHFIKGK